MQRRTYKTSLSLVVVVLANNKDQQPVILLDPNHTFPIISFSKRTIPETIPLLFEAYGIPDLNNDTTFEGILAVHSDHVNGIYHFIFIVYCRLNRVVEADMERFFCVDESVFEATPKQSHHLPVSVTVTCINYLCNLQSKWPTLKISDFPHSTRPSVSSQLRLDLVVFVVIVQDGKILLIKEIPKKGGGWFVPAGHMEIGEDVVMTAKRETREESGYQVAVEGVGRIVYAWGRYSPLHFVVKGKIVGGVIKKTPDDESDEAEWMDFVTVRREVREQITTGTGKYRTAIELDGILSVVDEYDEIIPLLTS